MRYERGLGLEKTKYYKYLFLIGAIWNWAVAIILFLVSIFMVDLAASIFGMAIPPSFIWFHIVVCIIFIFGIGYYIVGRDLTKNRGIVILGVLEKYLFFTAFLIYFLLGDINILPILLTIVDVIFSCLFLEFLINYKS